MSAHPGAVLIVTDFGAAGDGRTLCSPAIQKALDEAAARGGGVVHVPPGTYLTGTLHLRSRVALELWPGATLLGSPRIEDYPEGGDPRQGDRHQHHLIVAEDVEDVTIRGGGTIDGNGPAFWKPAPGPRRWIGAKSPRVSPMLDLRRCRRLRLENFSVVNSAGWNCHLFLCDYVWIRGVRLLNHLFGPNTDGFDINGCRDLMMSDCHVECGDDAICLKTTRDSRSCERITVTNCILRTNCVAFKCGTESHHDFRQIAFSNSVVHRSTRAVGLYGLDGGTIADVVISNIACDTNSGFILNRPIHLDLRKRTVESDAPPVEEQPISSIRNVLIQNFAARTDGRILMTAADGGRLTNVHLRGVHLSYPVVDDPYPVGVDAKGAQFSNRSPEARIARAAVVADCMDGLVVEGLTVDWPAGPPPADWGDDVRTENGSDRVFTGDRAHQALPDFHVLWGRNLKGGQLDCPLAQPSKPGLEKYKLTGSDIRVRE